VVGEFTDASRHQEMLRAAAADPRVTVVARSVTDAELADLLAAADASVLARSVDWTPSSLVLSLSSGTPVVAADLASNREHLGGDAFWFAPHDPAALAAALEAVVGATAAELAARGERGRAHVAGRPWHESARRTAEAFRVACGRAEPAPVLAFATP
jgi:glycosyltransferase involved in cell wall biosynthesis